MEDKPRTDLGQAEDKKDLRRAAYRGKVQFYPIFLSKSFEGKGYQGDF